MMASGGVPGIPSVSVGMKPPPTVALFADSLAITPFGSPRPKLSGVFEARRASAYAISDAMAPPAAGNMPMTVPMTELRSKFHLPDQMMLAARHTKTPKLRAEFRAGIGRRDDRSAPAQNRPISATTILTPPRSA